MTTTTTHLTPAELDALLEAARLYSPADCVKFIEVANPATIERLVLMVRELQRDNEKWQRAAGHRLTIATFRRQEEIWQQKNLEADTAVEHFRARAVGAILTHQPKYASTVVDDVIGALARVVESLPLVETEEE